MSKYAVIYADPPWLYNKRNAGTKFGAGASAYNLMPTIEIAAIPVKDWAADNSVLFMWATFPRLPDALHVMSAWGFTYKTVAFTWVKTTQAGGYHAGPGNYTASNAELVMLGTRGKPPKPAQRLVRQIIAAPRTGHSVKPEAAAQRIMGMYSGPYLELFARRQRDGWTCWGDSLGVKL